MNRLGVGKRVAGYCRYSSNNQREESIEAQERAIKEHCEKKGWVIVGWYEDRAQSGTTDKRDNFQRMISDSENDLFDIVLVHKLDRFSRDVCDKERYKRKLLENGAILQSVIEPLDDSPEGFLTEGVLTTMNAYFSKNLAREVMKGLRENAEGGLHTGGKSPFGYRVDPATKALIIEPSETDGVRMIFQMVLDGKSYQEIQQKLNERGFRTRFGNPFGVNSLHDILANEKYTGRYFYNKQASKKESTGGKRSPRKLKDNSEWIIKENAIPAIISKADFEAVQQIMKNRKHRAGTGRAKQVYLLSGKIVCGECGSAFAGNRRKATEKQKEYISYRCNRHNKSVTCHNVEVNRETLETQVLSILSSIIYDEAKIPEIMKAYEQYTSEQNESSRANVKRLTQELASMDKKLENTATAIANCGGSTVLLKKLTELECEHAKLNSALERMKLEQQAVTVDEAQLLETFRAAKRTFEQGGLADIKHIVQQCVESITVYQDRVEVALNLNSNLLRNALAPSKNETAVRSENTSDSGTPQYEGTVEQVKGIEPSYSAWEV